MIEGLSPQTSLDVLLQALELAGLGCTVVIDRGGRLERVYANQTLANMFGVELAVAREMAPMDLLTPSERARLGGLRTSLEAGKPGSLRLETFIPRADGTSLPIEVALAYVPLGDARVTFAFLRDTSAIHESEERFRRVAEVSPDSIAVACGSRYIYVNPAALRHLGLQSLEDLADFDPLTTVPVERRAELAEYIRRLAQGESLPPWQQRHPRPDGSEAVLESSLSFTKMSGQPAIISYTRDITEREAFQAERMKQDRLVSVGMLAAGVAHEINNPLSTLGLQARTLCNDADRHGFSPEVRRTLEQMDEAASRMQAIIQDLLFLARPLEQPQAYVDVAQVLTSTVALMRAGTHDCPPIHVELDTLPPIQGFASKLGQVFLNVLRNAVQAVEQVPEPEVRVRGRSSQDTVEIVISDNGVGIRSDLLPRLAQPFFTTKPHGTGLGLWISHAVMAQHGGKLVVKSAESRGTTVSLSLPLVSPR
ncbi:MAG TPA: ATP-binding protein [Polyangiaceae bacterium]|jgi:PAS domain S-box-containing protein|nr:ATP-binding protein [Polyangiaceae bacterium]